MPQLHVVEDCHPVQKRRDEKRSGRVLRTRSSSALSSVLCRKQQRLKMPHGYDAVAVEVLRSKCNVACLDVEGQALWYVGGQYE